jgi:hypothetical protein
MQQVCPPATMSTKFYFIWKEFKSSTLIGLRIATSLCVISYFIGSVGQPHGWIALNQIVAITESAAQFTSGALLLLRYAYTSPASHSSNRKRTSVEWRYCTATISISLYLWLYYCRWSYLLMPVHKLIVNWRFPGPILNIIAWYPQKAVSEGYSGCQYTMLPPSFAYLPFLFQAGYDLVVFILCTAKVRTTVWFWI